MQFFVKSSIGIFRSGVQKKIKAKKNQKNQKPTHTHTHTEQPSASFVVHPGQIDFQEQ